MPETSAALHATDPPWLAFLQTETATISIEYALLGALVAIMALVGVASFADTVTLLWTDMARDAGNALSAR